jgi:hypothetical protein
MATEIYFYTHILLAPVVRTMARRAAFRIPRNSKTKWVVLRASDRYRLYGEQKLSCVKEHMHPMEDKGQHAKAGHYPNILFLPRRSD